MDRDAEHSTKGRARKNLTARTRTLTFRATLSPECLGTITTQSRCRESTNRRYTIRTTWNGRLRPLEADHGLTRSNGLGGFATTTPPQPAIAPTTARHAARTPTDGCVPRAAKRRSK